MSEVRAIDPVSGIDHINPDDTPFDRRADGDAAIGRCVRPRVDQQVAHDLVEPRSVSSHDWQIGRQVQHDPGAGGLGLHCVRDTANDGVEVHGFAMQCELPGIGGGEILEIGDEPLEEERLLMERPDGARIRIGQAILDRLEGAAQVGHR